MRCMLGVERVAAGRVRVYRREFASFSGYEFGDSCNSSLRDMPARMPALPVIFAFFAHFRGDAFTVYQRNVWQLNKDRCHSPDDDSPDFQVCPFVAMNWSRTWRRGVAATPSCVSWLHPHPKLRVH
jgi:hypothetical protein